MFRNRVTFSAVSCLVLGKLVANVVIVVVFLVVIALLELTAAQGHTLTSGVRRGRYVLKQTSCRRHSWEGMDC